MLFNMGHHYIKHVSRIFWNYPPSPCEFHASDNVYQLLIQKYISHRRNIYFIGKFINFIKANRLRDYFCNVKF